MSSLVLAWANLWRKPARTVFTIVSLAVGFLLFGILQGVNSTFTAALGRTEADRLLINTRFGKPLPQSYASRIARVPGVRAITWTQFMIGSYQDKKNSVLILSAEPKSFFKVRDQYVTSEATIDALVGNRTGLIVLDELARQYGWKVGDRIAVQSAMVQVNGSQDWVFDIVGLMSCPSNPGQTPFAVANYSYLDTARAVNQGTVARFVIRISNPSRSLAISRAIDAEFANSTAPTLTLPESGYAAAELATIGDIGRLTVAVSSAVFFALLFLAGNVIRQSVRERTAELAVLKTLGFSDGWVLRVIALETLLLCSAGAIIGLAASSALFPFVAAYLPNLSLYLSTKGLSPSVLVLGLAIAAALSVLAGAIPAWKAKRLNIVEALRMAV